MITYTTQITQRVRQASPEGVLWVLLGVLLNLFHTRVNYFYKLQMNLWRSNFYVFQGSMNAL